MIFFLNSILYSMTSSDSCIFHVVLGQRGFEKTSALRSVLAQCYQSDASYATTLKKASFETVTLGNVYKTIAL